MTRQQNNETKKLQKNETMKWQNDKTAKRQKSKTTRCWNDEKRWNAKTTKQRNLATAKLDDEKVLMNKV